ncbi:hypothetical protein GCM10027046_24270 [Uliginosibacterium flavum]|uniref:Uncharacterized protein n=1 Tax=Uliginosibacterium flavum TaxID=1396831 RepID=A0ABV2TLD9_9RHOO
MMTPTIKYLILGAVVFVVLWLGSHLHIALAVVGGPAIGILFGAIYERIFPHAYDSKVKDRSDS